MLNGITKKERLERTRRGIYNQIQDFMFLIDDHIGKLSERGLKDLYELKEDNEILKKKYKVFWYEYHNPYNWGETYGQGVKELYASLPTKDIHPDLNENDGWVECVCIDEFEAKNPKYARQYVFDNYEIQSGVFSILDEKDYIVATEEGLEIPKRKGN